VAPWQTAIADIASLSRRETSRAIPIGVASALRGLPEATQDIEIQGAGTDNVTVAVAPNIMEELQGHPDPVLIIFERSVVVMKPSPNRGT
jgi:hypothetical protein